MPKPKKDDILREGLKAPPGYDNPRCQNCKLATQSYSPFIAPVMQGPWVFVLPAPSLNELALGQGYEWRIVEQIYRAAGLEDHEVTLATITRCAPMVKKTAGKTARTMCQSFLFLSLNHLTEPVRIIAMGADVAQSFVANYKSFDDLVGRQFDTVHGDVLVTYNPREYFHEQRDYVLNVGVLDAIQRHVRGFVESSDWHQFQTLTEV